jgi:chromosome segregation ATPase
MSEICKSHRASRTLTYECTYCVIAERDNLRAQVFALEAQLNDAAILVGKRGLEIESLRESLAMAENRAQRCNALRADAHGDNGKLTVRVAELEADRDSVTEAFNAAEREIERLRAILLRGADALGRGILWAKAYTLAVEMREAAQKEGKDEHD